MPSYERYSPTQNYPYREKWKQDIVSQPETLVFSLLNSTNPSVGWRHPSKTTTTFLHIYKKSLAVRLVRLCAVILSFCFPSGWILQFPSCNWTLSTFVKLPLPGKCPHLWSLISVCDGWGVSLESHDTLKVFYTVQLSLSTQFSQKVTDMCSMFANLHIGMLVCVCVCVCVHEFNLANRVWEGLDNLLVCRGHHTLPVDLDDPVTHTDPAALGNASSHQTAYLTGHARGNITPNSCKVLIIRVHAKCTPLWGSKSAMTQ